MSSSSPTYDDYERCIPQQNHWKLNEKIDFEHDGIDRHLGELAEVFEKWDDIAPSLGLSNLEIDDIMADFPTRARRRKASLKKWKSKKGYMATYGKLLDECVRNGSLNCAVKIVMLLGGTGGPSLNTLPAVGQLPHSNGYRPQAIQQSAMQPVPQQPQVPHSQAPYSPQAMLPTPPQAMQAPPSQSVSMQQPPVYPHGFYPYVNSYGLPQVSSQAAPVWDPQVGQHGIPLAPHVLGPGGVPNVPSETAAMRGNTRDDRAPLQSTPSPAVAAPGSSEATPHLPICLAPESQYTPLKSDGKIMQYEAKPRGEHVPELKLNKNPDVVEPISPKPFNQEKSELGYYDMKAKLHGTAFIFNNKTFLRHEERKGTERDKENLIQTFTYLGYRPVIFDDLKSTEMLYVFKNLDKYLKESDEGATKKVAHDSFICCILSHGNRGGIYGTDSLPVKREDIERLVGGSMMLRKRPKIFFIQACQGDEPGTEPVSTIHADGDTTSKRAHIYVCSATTFGDKAYRCEFKGSWFVVEVCKILCKSGKRYKLSDFQYDLNTSVANNESYRFTIVDSEGKETKKMYTQQTTSANQLQHDVHFFDGGDV